MKKILLSVLLVIVIVVAWILSTLDNRIENHIERTATKLAGVPVTIDLLEVSPLQGEGTIVGLKVANPEGYEGDYAFEMGSISFDIDIGSVLSQPLIVNELIFNAPVVNLEVKDNLQSNLQDIVNISNEQNQVGAASTDSATASAPEPESQVATETDTETGQTPADSSAQQEGNYLRIAFKHLEINNISLNARRGEDQWSDALPDITIDNLGGAEGIGTRELGIAIVRKLTNAALEQAAKRKLSDYVEDKVMELGDKLFESLLKD
jgi:hypothetical protein